MKNHKKFSSILLFSGGLGFRPTREGKILFLEGLNPK